MDVAEQTSLVRFSHQRKCTKGAACLYQHKCSVLTSPFSICGKDYPAPSTLEQQASARFKSASQETPEVERPEPFNPSKIRRGPDTSEDLRHKQLAILENSKGIVYKPGPQITPEAKSSTDEIAESQPSENIRSGQQNDPLQIAECLYQHKRKPLAFPNTVCGKDRPASKHVGATVFSA